MIFAAVPNIHIHKSLDGNYSLRKKEIWRHSHPLDFFKHVLNQNVQRGLNAFILEWRWSFPAGNRIHCLDLLCSKNVNQGMSSEENSLWKVKEKVSCLKDNRTPKLAFKQQSGQKREKQKHFRGVNSDTGSLTVNRHSYVGAQTVWLTNRSHRWCQLAQKSVTSHRGGGSRGSRQFTEDGDEDERSREPSMSSSVWFLVALRLRIKYIKTADRHDNMQPNHVTSCCNCNWSHTHAKYRCALRSVYPG